MLFIESFMKFRRHFPVMLGEYWIYALAVVILITTLTLLYSHNGPIGLPRWVVMVWRMGRYRWKVGQILKCEIKPAEFYRRQLHRHIARTA